ncbi:MAG TPA: DUF167 domain-containing protein [Ktedonobacterales bacterium]|jgi:hypothetical protein|nr:DUF167 domain-containing protein [Ktedonobacterales bacterium]
MVGDKTGRRREVSVVREERGRLLVAVRVTPRAARDDMALEGDRLCIRLHAPPVEGAANAALIELLAKRLGMPRRSVTLERGETSREKVLAIAGLSANEFWKRLGLA